MFRMWAAIFAVGAAGRRKVWTELVTGRPIFPNLFLFLVGPPGTGKTEAIIPATEHLRKSETTRLAPNDVTKQSLLDRLAKAADGAIINGQPIEFHYMALMVRELSNFMDQYDAKLAGILTDLFDNPPVNEESKRGRDDGKSVSIIRPGISMLAGTATKNLGATIGANLWGQGFMSRVILVYSAEANDAEWFGGEFDETGTRDAHTDTVHFSPELVEGLQQIGAMKGRIPWTRESAEAMRAWRADKFEPFPRHAKLVEYNSRRFLHVSKLALISAMSRLNGTIELPDFERARGWLEAAEAQMPEIFKEMIIHSDGEVLREMHMHAWTLYSRAKQPVPYTSLASFLYTRVAAREIPRLIDAAEANGMFDRMAGTSGMTARYMPKLHFDTGGLE